MTDIEKLKNKELICRATKFCMSSEIGIHKKMFGGTIMSEFDIACSVFVAEVCDTPWIVTKTMNVEFIESIAADQMYKIYVGIQHIGRTSIKLKAELRIHSVHTEMERTAMVAESVFVRINDAGEAIPISDTIRRKFGYDVLQA